MKNDKWCLISCNRGPNKPRRTGCFGQFQKALSFPTLHSTRNGPHFDLCACGMYTTAQAFLGYMEVSKVKAWETERTPVLSLSTSPMSVKGRVCPGLEWAFTKSSGPGGRDTTHCLRQASSALALLALRARWFFVGSAGASCAPEDV